MKVKFTFVVVSLFFGFAANTASAVSCKQTAEKAVQANANKNNRWLTLAGTKLISKNENTLQYLVQAFEQFSDGAGTYELPSEYFIVTATGTETNCVIKNIKKKK